MVAGGGGGSVPFPGGMKVVLLVIWQKQLRACAHAINRGSSLLRYKLAVEGCAGLFTNYHITCIVWLFVKGAGRMSAKKTPI